MLNGHEDLKPTLNEGRYVFQEADKILGEDASPILAELAEKNVLNPYLVDVEVSCPECGSGMLKDRYLCPFCGSFNLSKGTLMEHYGCGAVDFLEKFLRNGEYVCPKCNKPLKLVGTDYRKIENIYRCGGCKRSFSLPSIVHSCLKCEASFNHEGAKLNQVFGYRLNGELRNEITANCAIEAPLSEVLEKAGYSVDSPGMLLGSSGVDHAFDVVARKGEEVVAVSIASGVDEVGATAVVAHFAKAFDSRPTRSMIVAFPKLSGEAKKLATLYGIEVVEAEDIGEIRKKFEEAFATGGEEENA